MAGLWEIWIQHAGISKSYWNQVSCFKKLLLSSRNKCSPSFKLAAVRTDKRRKRESPAHMTGGMWDPGVALARCFELSLSGWGASIRWVSATLARRQDSLSDSLKVWTWLSIPAFKHFPPFSRVFCWESICKIPWERRVKQRWRECVVGVSPEIRILCVPLHLQWPQSVIWMPAHLGFHIFSVFLP